MNNYYFTFGSDPRYPYGINDYVQVIAHDIREAVAIFRQHHPDRPGTHLVNCAFYYTEEEFAGSPDKYYGGRGPVEILEAE